MENSTDPLPILSSHQFEGLSRIEVPSKNILWQKITREDGSCFWQLDDGTKGTPLIIPPSTAYTLVQILIERNDRMLSFNGPVLTVGRWKRKGIPESAGP